MRAYILRALLGATIGATMMGCSSKLTFEVGDDTYEVIPSEVEEFLSGTRNAPSLQRVSTKSDHDKTKSAQQAVKEIMGVLDRQGYTVEEKAALFYTWDRSEPENELGKISEDMLRVVSHLYWMAGSRAAQSLSEKEEFKDLFQAAEFLYDARRQLLVEKQRNAIDQIQEYMRKRRQPMTGQQNNVSRLEKQIDNVRTQQANSYRTQQLHRGYTGAAYRRC